MIDSLAKQGSRAKRGVLIFSVFCLFLGTFVIVFNQFFGIISPPEIIETFPQKGAQSVSLNSNLIIKFDKPVKRQEVGHFIFPEAYGEWRFEDPLIKNHLFQTLIFTPAAKFEPNTRYQVKIENIKGFGFSHPNLYNFDFITQSIPDQKQDTKEKARQQPQLESEITLLEIALDWQDHPLSCEAASLKMALAGKGFNVSEEEIMEKIGYDSTPYQNGTWGDPNLAYVGDIDGKICSTGYGVHWEPVAKAANNWRPAKAFSFWDLDSLIKEIILGNPVIVWGVLPARYLTDCSWYTPDGKYIKAYKETHVRLVIGFIGSPENPSKIIINDPLAGRLYWPTSYFLTNWERFDRSGVVIK